MFTYPALGDLQFFTAINIIQDYDGLVTQFIFKKGSAG